MLAEVEALAATLTSLTNEYADGNSSAYQLADGASDAVATYRGNLILILNLGADLTG